MKLLKRILNLLKGFLSSSVSQAEKSNPKILLENEKQNLRDLICRFNESLVKSAGSVHRMESQIKLSKREIESLTEKVQTYIKMGNNDMAGNYAAKLESEEGRLSQYSDQLKALSDKYKELEKTRDISIKSAKQKIEEIADKIEDIETNKIIAETNSLASDLVSDISDNNMSALESLVDEELYAAKGGATVSQSEERLEEIKYQEASEKLKSEGALDRFLNK